MGTVERKIEHVKICLEEEVESDYSGFEDIMFLHNALPEINFADVDTSIKFLGKKFTFPLIIASMTGGHPETKTINANLAEAVETAGIGMGVGSQRAAIEDKRLEDTFSIVREKAPKAFIYANIGIPQLIEYGAEVVDKIVEMVDADAVAIHLNYLQEAIQPEGNLNASGGLSLLEEVCRSSKVPIIVKETGAGISREVALKLKDTGVSALDVGGKGGTTFAGVEVYRASDYIQKAVGLDFWSWGIPTAFCIVDCSKILPTIATGGIRNGIDIAKSIAIGAKIASAALPFLKESTESAEEVLNKIEYFRRSFKIAMFLTACKSIEELSKTKLFVTGKFKEWLLFRGFDVKIFMEGFR